MAEMVSSAIVGETVNRIMSSLTGKDEERSRARENIERLEIAHIKMEAVLQISHRWQITDKPLLRWRSKLKRDAQECDDALVSCKLRALEDEEIRQQVSQSSFPKRIAHATNSLLSSFIIGTGNNNDESSNNSSANVVQRFERYANGAHEFLSTVEFGGTPLRYTFFNPLNRHLLSGKSVRYQAFHGNKLYYLRIRPMCSPERGVEAKLCFACHDFKEPANSLFVGCILRLSESTDIFDVIIRCMRPVTPHFKFAAEGVRRGFIQLPTQDFTWDSPYAETVFWDKVHNASTQWCRPNPLCCNEHGHHLQIPSSKTKNKMKMASSSSSEMLSNIFPEEVIHVLFKWHVSLLSDHQHTNIISSTSSKPGGTTASSSLNSAEKHQALALDVIDGKGQGIMLHTHAHLQELGDKLLPKAIDYLHQNSECKVHQMSFKSRHGATHLCVEKESILKVQTVRQTARKKRAAGLQRDIARWKQVSNDLLKLWVVRGSDKLKLRQGSIMASRNSALLLSLYVCEYYVSESANSLCVVEMPSARCLGQLVSDTLDGVNSIKL